LSLAVAQKIKVNIFEPIIAVPQEISFKNFDCFTGFDSSEILKTQAKKDALHK
jgi:hypothetical protein